MSAVTAKAPSAEILGEWKTGGQKNERTMPSSVSSRLIKSGEVYDVARVLVMRDLGVDVEVDGVGDARLSWGIWVGTSSRARGGTGSAARSCGGGGGNGSWNILVGGSGVGGSKPVSLWMDDRGGRFLGGFQTVRGRAAWL